jgi:tRNA-modifying protein YgfZ
VSRVPLQYVALNDRVCIEVQGADAAAFLHNQLSQALLDLDPAEAPLAAWADARGRIRALLRVCRLPERWLLATPRHGALELVSKLRLFVLRSKVTLAPATGVEVGALLGDAGTQLAPYEIAPDLQPNRCVRRDELSFIRVAERYWQVQGAPAALARLAATLEPADETAAALAEIRLGLPAIVPETAERYVAQMLNLDVLGAVSFHKGCYPGQEIIARVQNLGGVKRRARLYAAPSPPPPVGAPVLSGAQTAGEVLRSAPAGSGSELLAVVEHASSSAPLTCGGAPLRELPLPFTVPRD